MSLSEENLREKKFHNELQSKSKGRFEGVFYKAIYNSSEDFQENLKKYSSNSEVLDYGCGIGASLIKVAKYKPKKITGIDISEVSIQKAKDRIKELNNDIELFVDNCEKTKFNNNQFDVVYGTGILHHLKFSKCLDEILRILKPGGKFIFLEPLGTNPIINLYRKLTPNSRTPDEHPLIEDDFKMIEKKFKNVKIYYYGFFTLVFFPFYKSPKESYIFILKNLINFYLR